METAKCPTCSTPIAAGARCVTCAAVADGLVLLVRQDYATVIELRNRIEEAGLAPEMEQLPPMDARERIQPRWNLYVPKAEADRARALLGTDWMRLLGDEAAVEAARRGAEGVDLDAGGEITCPACGHVFAAGPAVTECPDCGLGLGAPE
jgi:hypothetical protein